MTSDYINSKAELEVFLPRVLKALDWMTHNMDTEGYNKWLCYKYNDHNGGHINQGWMDTKDSITYGVRSSPKDRPVPPIALVEVQGYAWKALHVWADILSTIDPTQSQKLLFRAKDLKRRFNEKFVMEDEHGAYLTHALDGNGAQIKSISINPGLALWASYKGESIVDSQYIPSIVARLISSGMFDRDAGIRTFENGQETYPEHDHYQTGDNQFWPISTVMAADGMRQLGYQDEAKMVMLGNLTLIKSSGSFVEHRMKKDGRFLPLFEKSQNSINQTWTAATALFSTAFLLNAPAFGFKERAAS